MPSNVKSPHIPNKTSHFYTKLPVPIELDKDKYEVALVQFIFPVSWYNIGHRRGNYAFFKVGPTTNSFYKQTHTLQKGYYASGLDLITKINESRHDMFKSYFEYDELARKAVVNIYEDEGIIVSSELSNALGFLVRIRYIDVPNFSGRRQTIPLKGTEVPTPFPTSGTSENPKKFHKIFADQSFNLQSTISSIFVYTDIVDNVIVGDSLSPLLRNVVVNGTFGDIIEREFYNPFYKNLNKGRIEEIEISLRDDTGNLIPFEFGKTLLRLHFRLKKEYEYTRA